MEYLEIARIIKGVPFISPENGKILYDFVRFGKFERILELGFAYGASTSYLAAAVHSNGSGRITSIDNQWPKSLEPSIHDLLRRAGLEEFVTTIYADTSYTWELMKLIERQSSSAGVCTPIFDFCFIDGAHTWETDGLAFFLVEKLLKPNGWLLFDDLNWTYATSPTLKATSMVASMPVDQRETPQIERVFSLLVRQHPNFGRVRVSGDWGWAQKVSDQNTSVADFRYLVDQAYSQGIKADTIALAKKVIRRLTLVASTR